MLKYSIAKAEKDFNGNLIAPDASSINDDKIVAKGEDESGVTLTNLKKGDTVPANTYYGFLYNDVTKKVASNIVGIDEIDVPGVENINSPKVDVNDDGSVKVSNSEDNQ